MNHSQVTKAPEALATNPSHVFGTDPSLRCATLLFVASASSFIGAGLLLASI
jgi:hypothetical protein